jgi:hypothetical protein
MLQVQILPNTDTINPRVSARASLDSRLHDQIPDSSRKPIQPSRPSSTEFYSLEKRSHNSSIEVSKGNTAKKSAIRKKHEHIDKVASLFQLVNDDTEDSDSDDAEDSSEALEYNRKQYVHFALFGGSVPHALSARSTM